MASTVDGGKVIAFDSPHKNHPTKVPLVVVHGGPGACHDYLLPLVDLHEKHGIPILFYDQLGNGRSTRLPHLEHDQEFWTEGLFIDELDNLLTKLGISEKPYDILGHSWGGMLVATWAAREPKNLRRVIISSSLASMDTWRVGIQSLVQKLPEDVQKKLQNEDGGKDFEEATDFFYQWHLSLKRPWPCPEVEKTLNWFAEDGTTYETLYGTSELSITGSLRDWSSIEYLHKIKASTLLINGEHDEAQDVAMEPFSRLIPNVIDWWKCPGAAHFVHVDKREEHMERVAQFLLKGT